MTVRHHSATEGDGAAAATENESKKSLMRFCSGRAHLPYQIRYMLIGEDESTGPMWYRRLTKLEEPSNLFEAERVGGGSFGLCTVADPDRNFEEEEEAAATISV